MRVDTVAKGGTTLPILAVDGAGDGAVGAAVDAVDAALLDAGAVYLRGAGVGTPEEFRAVVARHAPPLESYRGGNTPRTALADGVFTSTEYPPEYPISLHNEMSYAAAWPNRLYFACLAAPASGGATPVADGRAVLADMDAAVLARFTAHGVAYRQHLHGGFGLGKSWQSTFESDDRTAVGEHLRRAGAEFEWIGDDLRVRQVRPAVARHPVSGEAVWFCQADQWDPSNLPADEAELLRSVVGDDAALPHSVTYGDGSPIPAADLDHVREVAARHAVAVPWREGDLLVVDNMLAMHGREPYSGARRVVVAMT